MQFGNQHQQIIQARQQRDAANPAMAGSMPIAGMSPDPVVAGSPGTGGLKGAIDKYLMGNFNGGIPGGAGAPGGAAQGGQQQGFDMSKILALFGG